MDINGDRGDGGVRGAKSARDDRRGEDWGGSTAVTAVPGIAWEGELGSVVVVFLPSIVGWTVVCELAKVGTINVGRN